MLKKHFTINSNPKKHSLNNSNLQSVRNRNDRSRTDNSNQQKILEITPTTKRKVSPQQVDKSLVYQSSFSKESRRNYKHSRNIRSYEKTQHSQFPVLSRVIPSFSIQGELLNDSTFSPTSNSPIRTFSSSSMLQTRKKGSHSSNDHNHPNSYCSEPIAEYRPNSAQKIPNFANNIPETLSSFLLPIENKSTTSCTPIRSKSFLVQKSNLYQPMTLRPTNSYEFLRELSLYDEEEKLNQCSNSKFSNTYLDDLVKNSSENPTTPKPKLKQPKKKKFFFPSVPMPVDYQILLLRKRTGSVH